MHDGVAIFGSTDLDPCATFAVIVDHKLLCTIERELSATNGSMTVLIKDALESDCDLAN